MALDYNMSTLTADERFAEARRIIGMFGRVLNVDDLEDREKNFVAQMMDEDSCTPAQLGWLRRIKEKYM